MRDSLSSCTANRWQRTRKPQAVGLYTHWHCGIDRNWACAIGVLIKEASCNESFLEGFSTRHEVHCPLEADHMGEEREP